MKTFDEILPALQKSLKGEAVNLAKIGKLIINRDLNGLVRLVVAEKVESDRNAKNALDAVVCSIAGLLESRLPATSPVIYEPSPDTVLRGIPHFPLQDFPNVIIADRLLTENDWRSIAPPASGASRIVFFSIKGGVGRSTALAAAAWALAEKGKKVMVLDLDLESPGLSSSLLPDDKCPAYGITDWLVEDLLHNDEAVFPYMTAISDLSRNGEICIVPAHGRDPGEYIAKLGRVWMSKYKPDNSLEPWQNRLGRLLEKLENQWRPDVILIDSRAGIDEVASACITSLGAETVLLFAIDSDQTWAGYDILFRHWLRNEAAQDIRGRLRIVGALIPETNQTEYIDGLCEHAWNIFTESLYDTVPPGASDEDYFNYDKADGDAPHYPWPVMWNRGFAALQNVYAPLQQAVVKEQALSIFGGLIKGLEGIIKKND
ncbi:AAA family ATPase [Treponema sp. TIM-1]|uniref:KGGVGR-motif variant AAA ATPase n=1 Tax=Treponema sp. TIM-1 TaxID=2898417 RepID=UPI00398045CF